MNNFIYDIAKSRKDNITRFPPENNFFLHLGHIKSIYLNFKIGNNLGKGCNLRFDDTNPTTSNKKYAREIQKDLEWLGITPRRVFYTSSYFDLMLNYAKILIKNDDAYVCDLTSEEIKEYRGCPTKDGKESPSRNNSIEKNMELFENMILGTYEDNSYVLRLKIDMTSPNLHLRDPIIYRIKKEYHDYLDKTLNVYPLYDFAHCISDSLENITYSLCTLEFESHRPLYDWILDKLNLYKPQQIEFARLNLAYNVMSKRFIKKLVEDNIVNGYDDPRLPTISGMRRRGYSPKSLFNFVDEVGYTKRESLTDIKLLESHVRTDLNKTSERRLAILNPLKLTIVNYDEKTNEVLKATNNPEDESKGSRDIIFSKNLWIDKEDFKISANSKYKRMSVGKYTRLKYAYIVKCIGYNTDENGEINEVLCEYIPESKSGSGYNEIKPKGTIHFISNLFCSKATINLYDNLFNIENPLSDMENAINKNSLTVLNNCLVENSLLLANRGDRFQFERVGYFCVDKKSTRSNMIFNRTVELKSKY